MMISIKLRLNKSRQLCSGCYPLVLQVIYHRQKKIIYSPFQIAEESFDPKKEAVVFKLNGTLTKSMIKGIEKWVKTEKIKLIEIIEKLSLRNEPFTVSDIINKYHIRDRPIFLSALIDTRIEEKKEFGKLGTIIAYQSTRASIERFAKGKNIRLSEISQHFVREYELYLLKTGVSHNTVCYYMRNFRTIYNYALEEGYIAQNDYPFKNIRTKPCQTVKRALSREVMSRIASLPLPSGAKITLARDIFLFSFYSRGMSFVDIIFLKKEQIKDNIISYSRHKTGQQLDISLIPPLKKLIETYANPSECIFPFITEVGYKERYKQYKSSLRSINRSLKKIARMANTDIALTTYVARHTWATLARESGVPTAVISEGLGHTSENTTRIYLKQLDHGVIDKFNKIVSKLI